MSLNFKLLILVNRLSSKFLNWLLHWKIRICRTIWAQHYLSNRKLNDSMHLGWTRKNINTIIISMEKEFHPKLWRSTRIKTVTSILKMFPSNLLAHHLIVFYRRYDKKQAYVGGICDQCMQCIWWKVLKFTLISCLHTWNFVRGFKK